MGANSMACVNGKGWPRLAVSDGALEALKWLALLLMTADHANKFLFNGTNGAVFAAGRLAMPLFVFVLAYNLARPGVLERGGYLRTMLRLALFGVLSLPAFTIMGGLNAALRPLNIMFTLLVLAATLCLLEGRTTGNCIAAAVVFLAGGINVEFWWPAPAFGVAVWWYSKRPGALPLLLALASLAALQFVNGKMWALAAVPVIFLASLADPLVPRLRWVFYIYYPLHLFVLCWIRFPMAKAGYLFF